MCLTSYAHHTFKSNLSISYEHLTSVLWSSVLFIQISSDVEHQCPKLEFVLCVATICPSYQWFNNTIADYLDSLSYSTNMLRCFPLTLFKLESNFYVFLQPFSLLGCSHRVEPFKALGEGINTLGVPSSQS